MRKFLSLLPRFETKYSAIEFKYLKLNIQLLKFKQHVVLVCTLQRNEANKAHILRYKYIEFYYDRLGHTII